jgi:beta-lactamase regulating signal transducer with metallopeptidase domain/lipopolysaccharide export system protein LptA
MMFDGVIERLNLWGDQISRIAWPLFWQSSILMAGMFLLDLFLRRRLRASVRHALWLVVLIKLLLPPAFAFPTGAAWWLRPREVAPAKAPVTSYVVTYGPTHATIPLPASSPRIIPAPQIRLSRPAWALFGTAGLGLTLLIVMLARWQLLRHQLRISQLAPLWLQEMVHETQRKAGCRRRVRLMLTDASISPALWGLLRPVIVLPTALVQQLRPDQLQAVLLHELFHLRNGDVWVNCFQSLMQIVFWWHPFLWLANARIRRIREEVVDDSVRLALGEEAESYAPTLLEVARLALARPLATLGLVGILESRNALKQRVDRLVNFPAPRRVGLSIISGFAILAFASVALPMGQAPPKKDKTIRNSNTAIQENGKAAESAKLGWDIQPLTDKGWVQYDLASGIGTVTNGAKVTHGGTTISADQITFNQQTREVVANGSVKIQSGATNPAAEIEPVSKSDWIKYDAATGTVTATNHAVLRRGDQVIEADNIIVNGHYNTISASGNPTLQLAQAQTSANNPPRAIHTSSGRRNILNKLDAIRLDHVTFDNFPLSEVVNYLRDEAKKRDPEGKGINFLIYPFADTPRSPGTIDPATGLAVAAPEVEPVNIESVTIRILPPLNDVRMHDVLDAIIKVADKRIRYSIEDYGVSFRLAGNDTPVPLFTRVIKVDPNAFAQGLESVVGFSVGNFQTGGQGGGGQGNSSGVTVPRVQVAPNTIGGQGGQGGQGGVQGGGGISGVTRPTTTMISPQSIRQFFVNAGVDLTPPKSIFFDNRAGTLLVHATLNDLDIIEQAVGVLSTTAGLPAAARAINTSSNPVSPQTNLAKIPILGDLPFVGQAFTRTVEVSPANSPDQIDQQAKLMSIQKQRERLDALYTQLNDLLRKYTEKHPSVQATRKQIEDLQNQLSANKDEKLITRIMKVDPATFFEWVKKTAGLADNSSSQETMDAFRKILLNNGLQLAPPANIFYSEPSGSLFVRAIAPEMDAIEQIVQELNRSSAQISIQAKFVEVSEKEAKTFGLNEIAQNLGSIPNFADTNVAILSDPWFRVVLHALETRDGVDLIAEQSVTTLSGRQAQVQTGDIQTIVKLNPLALVSPGVASSNVYVTQPLYSGPVLDIIPYVSGNDEIQLNVTATVTEFVGYDAPEPGEAVPVYLDGQATTTKPPHPRTHVRTMQTAATLHDGQTLVLGRPKDEMVTYDKEGKALSTPSTTKKNLYVFVTATLIDAKGNPVHNPAIPSANPGPN